MSGPDTINPIPPEVAINERLTELQAADYHFEASMSPFQTGVTVSAFFGADLRFYSVPPEFSDSPRSDEALTALANKIQKAVPDTENVIFVRNAGRVAQHAPLTYVPDHVSFFTKPRCKPE